MKRLIVAVLVFGAFGFAEDKKPELKPESKLVLENAQLKLKLSFVDLQKQQAEFQGKFQEFNKACEAAVKELNLAEGTRCNPETLEFVPPSAGEKK